MSIGEERVDRELRLRHRIDELTDERDRERERADDLERQLIESRAIARTHYESARSKQRTIERLQDEAARDAV